MNGFRLNSKSAMAAAIWAFAGLTSGCAADSDGDATPEGDGGQQAAGGAGNGPDADPGGAGPVGGGMLDATAAIDAAVTDAAPVEPVPDALPSAPVADAGTPCDDACARFTECAVSDCEGFSDADADAIGSQCAALCAENPAFATVVNGSGSCADVIEFGRARAGDAFIAACEGPDEPPPLPDGSECRFECVEGEVCVQGHCVRNDGTCAGDIHCETGTERCEAGQCVPAEFAPCRGDDECHSDQFCLTDPGNPLAGGSCLFDCSGDLMCPFNERCYPEYGDGCYYELCGEGYANGDPLGACMIDGANGFPGTCFPLPAENGVGVGICLEAGVAAEGEACDLQVEGRDAAAQAVNCAPGTYCWGDYDDGELPPTEWTQIGACAGLCDPREPACSDGRTCIDLSNGDDPATREDETRVLGICLLLECDLFPVDDGPPQCGEGEACRVTSVSAVRGECGPAGDGGRLDFCESHDDCAGIAFCGGNRGGGENPNPPDVCVPLCDPAVLPGTCVEGETCYVEDGWIVGFCIVSAGLPVPLPDAGMEPDPVDAGVAPLAEAGVPVEPAEAGLPVEPADAGVAVDVDARL